MAFIRSVSGLRATLGDGLNPSVLANYASAFSQIMPEGPIIIGRDGRPSGKWIEDVISGTLQALGREVYLLGVVPTPTVQYIVEENRAAGGIAITASHNPDNWNGMKFINNKGVFLDIDENNWLWDKVERNEFVFAKNSEFPKVMIKDDAINRHISSIFNFPLFSNDIERKVKEMGISVVVDAVNASGSFAVPNLLERFGVRIHKLHCDSSGVFPHIPEPIPANLSSLCQAVKDNRASFGIAVDPDCDRLVLIDENGNPIGEEKTIALAIMAVMEDFDKFHGYNKIAVINHSTSMLSDRAAELYNAKIERAPVGEINVVNKMRSLNAVIGGEGSGGVILPASHYGRDALVGIALILHLITKLNMKLSQVSAKLGETYMVKTKISMPDINPETTFDKISKEFASNTIIREDGIKILFNDAWVQLRASNTEPIIRIIAESDDQSHTEALIKEFTRFI